MKTCIFKFEKIDTFYQCLEQECLLVNIFTLQQIFSCILYYFVISQSLSLSSCLSYFVSFSYTPPSLFSVFFVRFLVSFLSSLSSHNLPHQSCLSGVPSLNSYFCLALSCSEVTDIHILSFVVLCNFQFLLSAVIIVFFDMLVFIFSVSVCVSFVMSLIVSSLFL